MSVSQVSVPQTRRERLHATALVPVLAIAALVVGPSLFLGHLPMVLGLVTYAAISLVVLTQLQPYHPFDTFGAANLVTLVRAAIIAVLIGLFLTARPLREQPLAFGLAALALLLDGVDGWLARRSRMVSRFGARFDMEMDALLILVLSALAYVDGKAGAWVLLLGLMRYVFVAAGHLVPALNADLPYSFRRKAVCVAQMAVLTGLALPSMTSPWSDGLALLCLVALAWSFLVDTLWLLRATPRA